MRRWVGMTTTTTRRGLRRGLRPRRRQQPLRQRTRLPTSRSRAWHGQPPALNPCLAVGWVVGRWAVGWVVVLVAPVKNTQGRALSPVHPVPESGIRLMSLTQKPSGNCCGCSYREGLRRLHKVRRRICRRCLGSWSSRCLVWLRLTTLAKLCLVAGEVGQVGLVRLAMLVVEVVGLLVVVGHPRPRRPLPRRWDTAPRVALPERRRLTRTRTRRRTRTSKCPCQTRHSIRPVRCRLQPLRTARRLYRAAA